MLYPPVLSGVPPVGAAFGASIMMAVRGGFMLRPGTQPGTSSNSSLQPPVSSLFQGFPVPLPAKCLIFWHSLCYGWRVKFTSKREESVQ